MRVCTKWGFVATQRATLGTYAYGGGGIILSRPALTKMVASCEGTFKGKYLSDQAVEVCQRELGTLFAPVPSMHQAWSSEGWACIGWGLGFKPNPSQLVH